MKHTYNFFWPKDLFDFIVISVLFLPSYITDKINDSIAASMRWILLFEKLFLKGVGSRTCQIYLVKPHCSNFRIITSNFGVSKYLGKKYTCVSALNKLGMVDWH